MDIQFTWDELREVCQGTWLTPPECNRGVTTISTDTRALEPGMAFLALTGDRFDGHNFTDAAQASGAICMIVQKPVDADVPTLLVNDTLSAYQLLAAYHRKRFSDVLMIGITGSSGKTSSKEIIAAVVEAIFGDDAVLLTRGNTNNHIGVPKNLLRLTDKHKCAVLEMGTNSPGEIELLRSLALPEIAVLTNIGPVHLEGLGSIEGVAEEKSDIFDGSSMAILPWEYAEIPTVKTKLPDNTVTTGFDDAADIVISDVENKLTESRFSLTYDRQQTSVSWGLTGRHMALNAAAAFAIGHYLGKDSGTIAEYLKRCRNESMRMQVIEVNERTYVNDAYNANPDSMKALIHWLRDSLKSYDTLHLVLGDMLELGPGERDLHKEVIDEAVRHLPGATVYCFGPRMTQIAGDDQPTFEDISALRTTLDDRTAPGDIIAFKGSRGMGLERLLPKT